MPGSSQPPPAVTCSNVVPASRHMGASSNPMRVFCLQDFIRHPIANELLHNGEALQVRTACCWGNGLTTWVPEQPSQQCHWAGS